MIRLPLPLNPVALLRHPVFVAVVTGVLALALAAVAIFAWVMIHDRAIARSTADLERQARLLALHFHQGAGSAEDLQRFQRALNHGQGSLVGLVEGDGTIRGQAPVAPPLNLKGEALDDAPGPIVSRGTPVHVYADGIARFTAIEPVLVPTGQPPLFAVVAIPVDTALGVSRGDQLAVGAAAGALAILIVVGGVVLARMAAEARTTARHLTTREAELRDLFEHATEGIYRAGLDGRPFRASPAMARMHGYEDEAQMLAAVEDQHREWFVEPGRLALFLELLLREGSVRGFSSEVQRRRTGEHFWATENAWIVQDADGRVLYYEGTVQDVTERRRVEEELRHARLEAEVSNRTKSTFLANMSHELRTPLNAIIGFSEVLQTGIAGALNPRQADYIQDVLSSGRHLLDVINDILDISKIEAGYLELQDQLVSIPELVEDCAHMVRPLAHRRNVAMALPQAADDLPALLADQHRVRQMLLNLLSNALKFSPEGSAIAIDSALDEGGGIVLSVTDQGIGMTEDEIAIALIPFRQVEGAMARRHEGTGLGLPLVKVLIERHGGRLDITSTKGEGTRVALHFPPRRTQWPGQDMA